MTETTKWKEWAIEHNIELAHLAKEFDALEEKRKDCSNKRDQSLKEIKQAINKLRLDFEKHKAVMNIKAGIWAAIGAAIPVVVMLALTFMRGGK